MKSFKQLTSVTLANLHSIPPTNRCLPDKQQQQPNQQQQQQQQPQIPSSEEINNSQQSQVNQSSGHTRSSSFVFLDSFYFPPAAESFASPQAPSSTASSAATSFSKLLPPNMVSETNRSQFYPNNLTNYLNMNHHSINNNNNSARVVGVILTSDRLCEVTSKHFDPCTSSSSSSTSSNCLNSFTVLESIVLEKDINLCSAEELRRAILSQLVSAPKKFSFLTKEGWPVSQVHEAKLIANQIVHDNNYIKIKQSYDKTKIGIEEEKPLGFVFSDVTAPLDCIREEIDAVLKELAGSNYDKLPDYLFIDRNGWPVLKTQEVTLSTLDLLQAQSIKIRFDRPIAPVRPNSLPHNYRAIGGSVDRSANVNSPSSFLTSPHSTSVTPVIGTNGPTLSLPDGRNQWNSNVDGMVNGSIRQENYEEFESVTFNKQRGGSKKGGSSSIIRTFSKRKSDKVIRIKPSLPTKKHLIMLSYARAEAADHALNLKQELIKLNVSTYLDVHEISTGTDWQDSLNDAVSNCIMFVPLVTPMYGNTQWTNREVKLADILAKKIVPINFLDTWPPECLAIQFATTQYVNWLYAREQGDPHNEQLDGIKVWPKVCIKNIAKSLVVELNKYSKENKDKVKAIGQTNQQSIDLPPAMTPSLCYSTIDSAPSNSRLVVISVHPEEYQIAKKIRESLEQENQSFEIWCSCDQPTMGISWEDPGPKTNSTLTPTASCLPTICEGQEGNNGFNENYAEFAKRLVTSKGQRPKSMPPMESIANEQGDTIDSGSMPPSFSVHCNAETNSSSKSATNAHTSPSTNLNYSQSLGPTIARPKKLSRMLSQLSDGGVSSRHSSLAAESADQIKKFKSKIDKCRVVVVIFSDSYCNSSTSREQLFYCNNRKKLIVLDARSNTESSFSLLSNLIKREIIVEVGNSRYPEIIKGHIKRLMNPNATDTSNAEDWYDKKIKYCVDFMKKNIDFLCKCIYVLGSIRITDQRTIEICQELGKALAAVKNLTLVTSGYKGAQELVAKSFLAALKGKIDENGEEEAKSRIVHVLPSKEVEDDYGWCSQVNDGHFEPMSYGRTLFLGDTIAEQKTVLSRLLDTAILIQGDKKTAREVEEFLWNDHFVIPIMSTGGAASGEHDISFKAFQKPNGVSDKDWASMNDKTLEPSVVAKSVADIVVATKEHISNMVVAGNTNKKSNASKFKTKLRKSSKKRVTIDKIEFEKSGSNVTLNANVVNSDTGNQSPEKSLPIVEVVDAASAKISNLRISNWKRVQKIFSKGC